MQCPECETPHCTDCWIENEGCAIYGCKKKGKRWVTSLQRVDPRELVKSQYVRNGFLTLHGLTKDFVWGVPNHIFIYPVIAILPDSLLTRIAGENKLQSVKLCNHIAEMGVLSYLIYLIWQHPFVIGGKI